MNSRRPSPSELIRTCASQSQLFYIALFSTLLVSAPDLGRMRTRADRYTLFAGLALTLAMFGIILPSRATMPDQAKIGDILGSSSELGLRRNGREIPVQTDSVMYQWRDDLITFPPNNARALLRFFLGDEDLNLNIQTNSHEAQAVYYFPCTVQGGDFLIGWGLKQNESRGCETGLQVQSFYRDTVPEQSRNAPWMHLAEQVNNGLKAQLAQLRFGNPKDVYYCSTSGPGGAIGFAVSQSEDPCDRALENCTSTDDDVCAIDSTGQWSYSEDQLQASLICGETTVLTATGTGATFADNIESLLQPLSTTPSSSLSSDWSAVASNGSGPCTLDVYRPQDFVIVPAPDDVVMAVNAARDATGGTDMTAPDEANDAILVQTRDTPTGLEVDVLRGAINVRSSRDATPLLLTEGERYRHRSTESEVTRFSRAERIASVDIEVLCSFSADDNQNLNLAICDEAGFDRVSSTGHPITFCNREQAAGGQQGDRRIVQMNTNQGEVELEYEMYDAQDRLDVFYEGQRIGGTDERVNDGFVSGSERLTIPFSGRSGRLEVVVTGSPDIPTTKWEYTLYCPR